jgi:ABC-2 type transport system permease protein
MEKSQPTLPALAPSLSRAFLHLTLLSMLRQYRTWTTGIALVLLLMCATLVVIRAWAASRGQITWTSTAFAESIVLGAYLGFLLPVLCLCLGTQSLGGEWEDRSLIWLLIKPLPRAWIYLAKFLSAVPWTCLLALGGLILLGTLGGEEAMQVVAKTWYAVLLTSLAYLSVFVLLGAWLRRATVVAVAYSFVFEMLIGNIPGLMKRASISFYARCMIFATDIPEIVPSRSTLYMPVDSTLAEWVLLTVTVGMLGLGMLIFQTREYET